MDERISVVIPVYNTGKFLDRCLESVVNQTYCSLEILLIDDGSTDESGALCDAWAKRDSRIRVIHKQNAGLGMARNTGIDNAKGKYICFFDSDDFVDTGILAAAVETAEREHADITVFGLASADKTGNVKRENIPAGEPLVFSGDAVQKVFLPDLICCMEDSTVKNLSLSMCVGLFRTELLNRAAWRMVSEREIISEDSYSLIQLYAHVERVAVLPRLGYYYCENQSSLTHTYRPERFDKLCHFYRETAILCEKLGYSERVKTRVKCLYLNFVIGALKLEESAPRRFSEKVTSIRRIIDSELLQAVLKDCRGIHRNIKKRIFFWAMEKRCVYLCICLLAAQNTAGK